MMRIDKLRSVKILCFMLCLLMVATGNVFADRKIYVGDIIKLKVSGALFTEEEIREKFKEFEVVDFRSSEEGCTVSVRTFDVGKKEVDLGDKKLEIEVFSKLEGTEGTLIDGDSELEKKGGTGIFKWVFFIVAGVFLVSGFGVVVNIIKKRKIENTTPFNRFTGYIDALDMEDSNLLEKATVSFKTYIEERFTRKVRGKTSSEIMGEIMEIPQLDEKREELNTWLRRCDRFKFSKDTPSDEDKREMIISIKKIVRDIDSSREGESK